MKKLLTLTLCVGLCFALTACGSENNSSTENNDNATKEVKEEPLDLTGNWKSADIEEGSEMWFEATIDNSTITINWVDNEGTKYLYWVGTYDAPTEATDEYSWTSTNDHTQTDSAILASSDDTKDFTYSNNQLSYEATALGVTKTFYLEKEQ